jgi:uncharacterized damage-inducible protein DinB
MSALASNMAKHFREVFNGGNWTVSNVRDQLKDVTRQQSVQKAGDLNTIATLTFHIGYFVRVALKVLEGGPLEGKDSESLSHPAISNQQDWDNMVSRLLEEAERFALLVAELPDEKMWEPFADQKYGNYYRNIHGIIEHTHYHLGQIALVKKLVR